MQLRRVEKVAIGLAIAGGAALSPGTLSGDAGRLLVTFLGIVAASILPTITLLVNSMTASGRSVLAIDKLDNEFNSAMDSLFLFLGCVGVAVGALIALAISPPTPMRLVPYLTSEILPRIGQLMVVTPVALVLIRAGQIPGILRRILKIRHEIAVEEARKKIEDNAPASEAVRASFETHPDFGKTVTLQELTSREKH